MGLADNKPGKVDLILHHRFDTTASLGTLGQFLAQQAYLADSSQNVVVSYWRIPVNC
jgi:hypothetical protein